MTAVEGFSSSDPELTMLAILVVFGCVHSGLAFLRPYGARRRRGREMVAAQGARQLSAGRAHWSISFWGSR